MNILVSGGTGSGKTTLLNVLSAMIPDNERIVTIEDAAELRLQQRHVVRLESRPPNIEGKGEVRARELVRNALRMRPDRIVVGEVRGAEALDMLQAMNTGHDGSLSTLHANSPRDALSRVETMVLMAGLRPAGARHPRAGRVGDRPAGAHQPRTRRRAPGDPRVRRSTAWRARSSPCPTSSRSTREAAHRRRRRAARCGRPASARSSTDRLQRRRHHAPRRPVRFDGRLTPRAGPASPRRHRDRRRGRPRPARPRVAPWRVAALGMLRCFGGTGVFS